jgi:hypothetical protein
VRWFSDEVRWLLAHASYEKAAYLPMQVIIEALVAQINTCRIYSTPKGKHIMNTS